MTKFNHMESQENKHESKKSIDIEELENRIVKLEVDFKNRIEQLENRMKRFEIFSRVGF